LLENNENVNAFHEMIGNLLYLAGMVSKGPGQMGKLGNGAEIYEVG